MNFNKGHIPWNKGITKEQMLSSGKKVGSWPKGRHRDPETNKKISLANKGKRAWNKGLTRVQAPSLKGGRPIGIPPWNKGRTGIYSEETLSKIATGSRRWKRSEEHLRKLHEGCKAAGCSQEARIKIGKASKKNMKRLWKDPEYVLNQIRKRGVKPNKSEQSLMLLFEEYLPDFKYNGDGRLGVVLLGLVPDFVNVNGKKQVIEIFGEYFHSKQNKRLKWHQTEVGRIMAYNSLGYDCLIIWSKELRNKETLMGKIASFINRRQDKI